MKLYDVPAGAHVKVVEPDWEYPEDVYKFFHVDGMYSYCTDKEGRVVHLQAWTNVEIVE